MTPVEHLDLATVLEVSRAVSGETDLEKLIATILRLSLEHAGADRGLLILPSGDAHRINAEATIGSDGTRVELRHAPITSADLPASVFDHVLRTREIVLLQEASGANAFSDDEYLRRQRVRSVICLPLLKQTRAGRSDLPREQSDIRRPDRCPDGAFGAARHPGGHFT